MLQPVPQGDGNYKNRQKNIFQPAEHPGKTGFFDLRRRDLVQQLLNQANGTEPATDRTAKNDTEKSQNPQYIPSGLMTGCSQCVLDRAQRAGAYCTGAGIAVKPRYTGIFCLTYIDFSIDKALQMGIIEQRAVQLHQTAGAGSIALPQSSISVIQGQHTPYRYLRLWCARLLHCRSRHPE